MRAMFLYLALISLGGVKALNASNSSCQPFAEATFTFGASPYQTPVYDCWYAYRSFVATVTLSDCTVWRTLIRFFYGVKTNITFGGGVQLSYTAGATVDRLEEQRQEIANQTGIPAWMTNEIVLPYYDKFFGPRAAFQSTRQNGSRYVTPIRTTVDVVFIDMTTLSIVPWRTACWMIAERVPYINAMRHYWAFYGYAPFGVPHHIDSRFQPIFGSETFDRAQSASVLISAYLTPISVILLRFALLVVKKALDASDAHIYSYHKSLTIADILIAHLAFAKEMLIVAYVAVPFCLAWPQAFVVAMETKEWLHRVQQSANDIALVPITSIVLFTYTVQALLAIDRFTAIFAPLRYVRIANAKQVNRFLLAALGVNLAVLLAELSTNQSVQCMLVSPDAERCATDTIGSRPFSYGQLPRPILMVASSVIQLVCCSAVFVKMLLRFRNPEHNTVNVSRKLVPFYLLLGTCCVGMLGLAFEMSMVACEYAFTLTSMIPIAATNVLIGISRRFRISVLSGCSSWSVILHLLVSSHCRAAARLALADFRNILLRPVKSVQKRFKVQPESKPVSNALACSNSVRTNHDGHVSSCL